MAAILIVDDSSFSRRVLRGILEQGGHTVEEATDALSALEMLSTASAQLVTMDLTMQGMNGVDALQHIHALRPELPVVVATADIQQATRQLVNDAGAVGFIAKPFTATDVLSRVDQVLRGVPAW